MRLLDTNVCVEILRGTPEAAARLAQHTPGEVRLSSIVKAELHYGARISRDAPHNLRMVEDFCRPLHSLPFDDDCARAYGQLRADLQRRGQNIGANDLMIAATALAHGVILVTHNSREFERVTGLSLEDWQASF